MANILIVEDNRANLKLATLVLERAGHTVRQAADGETALRLIDEERPDLVLLDIQMPGIDGLELTRRVRAAPATTNLKIIALTAQAMKGDAERILSAGCDEYVAKPFSYADLLAKVDGVLGSGVA